MVGRRALNLTRRNGVYYFRGFIPRQLQARIGRREVCLSLRTRNRPLARRRALAAAMRLESLCSRLAEMQHADTAAITIALREFGRNLLAADPPPPAFTELSQEDSKSYAQDMTDEAIIDLEMVIDCDAYDNRNGDRLESGASAVRAAERTFWRVSKIDPSALSAGARLMVQQGVARVLVERHNQYNHRLTDRVLPYQPRDPLLAHPAGAPAVNAIHRGAPTATARLLARIPRSGRRLHRGKVGRSLGEADGR